MDVDDVVVEAHEDPLIVEEAREALLGVIVGRREIHAQAREKPPPVRASSASWSSQLSARSRTRGSSGPSSGTGAAEAALVNTLSPGARVLIFETGHFSFVWQQLAERLGLNPRGCRFDSCWVYFPFVQ